MLQRRQRQLDGGILAMWYFTGVERALYVLTTISRQPAGLKGIQGNAAFPDNVRGGGEGGGWKGEEKTTAGSCVELDAGEGGGAAADERLSSHPKPRRIQVAVFLFFFIIPDPASVMRENVSHYGGVERNKRSRHSAPPRAGGCCRRDV